MWAEIAQSSREAALSFPLELLAFSRKFNKNAQKFSRLLSLIHQLFSCSNAVNRKTMIRICRRCTYAPMCTHRSLSEERNVAQAPGLNSNGKGVEKGECSTYLGMTAKVASVFFGCINASGSEYKPTSSLKINRLLVVKINCASVRSLTSDPHTHLSYRTIVTRLSCVTVLAYKPLAR